MAEPVRLIFGNSNEAIQAQGDTSGRLFVQSYPGYFDGLNQAYEGTITTGTTPITHDFNADAGRNAMGGWVINDGAGNIKISISQDGLNFGDQFTVKNGETISLNNMNIDKIRVTRVGDASYRINLI